MRNREEIFHLDKGVGARHAGGMPEAAAGCEASVGEDRTASRLSRTRPTARPPSPSPLEAVVEGAESSPIATSFGPNQLARFVQEKYAFGIVGCALGNAPVFRAESDRKPARGGIGTKQHVEIG